MLGVKISEYGKIKIIKDLIIGFMFTSSLFSVDFLLNADKIISLEEDQNEK